MGVKSKKKAKTRLDAYYRLAKDQGYRARSAFKLIQLNRKYDFLAKSKVLVDLCAAPGGWCQVAAKFMPIGSQIVGVDLVPIAPIRGCKTFVGDITDDKTRKIIVTHLKKEPVDCVIHDGAPNVGGVWARDLFDQNSLVLSALKMACSMLKPDGWFVTKVFRSGDFHKLLWVMKELFEKVEATKPLASRMESAEIFVVCAGFKAPKSIDPSMFSAAKVFADVGEEKIMTASGALVTPKSNVPMGYDDFATIAHRVANFSEFIVAADPKGFLKTYQELRFSSDEDKEVLKHKGTKKELVYLCGDLQQVGDGDCRRLLRWREAILRERTRQQIAAGGLSTVADGDVDEDGVVAMAVSDDDESGSDVSSNHFDFDSAEGVTSIARELLEIRKKQAKELKKKQKRLVDRKLKQIKGLINYDPNAAADSMNETEGFGGDSSAVPDAFNYQDGLGDNEEINEDGFTVEKLALIDEHKIAALMDKDWGFVEDKGNDPLNPVVNVNLSAQEDWDLGDVDNEANADEAEKAGVIDLEGGGESHMLVEGAEHTMDVDNYGNYVPAKRSARVTLYEEGFGEDEEAELTPAEQKKAAKKAKDDQDLFEAGKQSKWQRHHLNIDKVLNDTFPKVRESARDKKKTLKRQRTFDEERITMSAGTELADSAISKKKKLQRTRFADLSSDDEDNDGEVSASDYDDDDDDMFSDAGAVDRPDIEVHEGRADSRRKKQLVPDLKKLTTQELVRAQRKQTLLSNKEARKQNKRNKNNANSGSSKGGKEDTTFEEIPIALTDPHIRARTLAIAQKMLDPRACREILDASVNRYNFNDDDDLPDWFIKDEQRNCKIELPVTAGEIEEQRVKFQELNARPSKKVMEAVGRKHKRAQRMLRNLMEKGKADPRAREKASGLSVRTLMRAQAVKGQKKKKNKYMDSMSFGVARRDKQRARREKKGGRKS